MGGVRGSGQGRALDHIPPERGDPHRLPRPVRPTPSAGHRTQRGDRGPPRSPRRGRGPPGRPTRGDLHVGERRRGASAHECEGACPVDGHRPALPRQRVAARAGRGVLCGRPRCHLGGRRRRRTPLPLHRRTPREPLRRHLPAPRSGTALQRDGLRVPHRLRPRAQAGARTMRSGPPTQLTGG